MSGVVILGKDSSNNVLKPVELTTAGLIKCDVSGVALASNQATGNSSLGSIATNTAGLNGCVSGTELQVDIVSSALATGASTAVNQGTGNTSLATIATNTTGLNGCVSGTELQVDVVSQALPTGASTAMNQGTGNSSLATIATLSAKGQGNKAASLSVTIASDQGALSVSSPAISVATTTIMNNVSQATGGTASSSVIDMRTAKCVAIYGANSDTTAAYKLMASSTAAGTYYEINSVFLQGDYSTGDFGIFLSDVGASYLRLDYTNDSGVTKVITAIAEVKN